MGVRQSHLTHTPTTTLRYTHHQYLPYPNRKSKAPQALLTSFPTFGRVQPKAISCISPKPKAAFDQGTIEEVGDSGANFAWAYTVEFGTCKFPDNFTGCQDLAKQKKVKFISEDLALECEGKDKYKCGSNVFWKW
ncbi:photosystem I reaction center subunit PSI-N, chloroplast, putative [Actinidia rufa]|uniref:Photosystem I reaction center subunit PSI-N, chloroplast, putative n=1 Tax=Actinidia rufa TaxID=165716 RepID=A0A7J0EMH5_9ERIC|nr:photosystem I reaction center subunit PSI-N, chloroplast, putative [Actinidia rufa]